MRTGWVRVAVACVWGAGFGAGATTFYVAPGGSDGASGLSWADAKQTIQAAVNATTAGDLVLVTNGTYASGGQTQPGYALTNRVVIHAPITVQSVNGAGVTTIRGAWDPISGNGPAAVRCVYLTNGALLVGFTLTNGATLAAGSIIYERSGGGLLCEVGAAATGCVIVGNSASVNGGGAYRGTFDACTLAGNRSDLHGGGAALASLNNCTLVGNVASNRGGAVYQGTAISCGMVSNTAYEGGGAALADLFTSTLEYNVATFNGGGSHDGSLSGCILRGNSAANDGGGANVAELTNCLVVGNSAASSGGGLQVGSAYNCIFVGNEGFRGGGARGSIISGCTIVGNTGTNGGGTYEGSIENSIVYFNSSPNGSNALTSTFFASCTAPMPGLGSGNITADPLFENRAAGNFQLLVTSPCRNSGSNELAIGATDFAGAPRTNGVAVDMGALEFADGDNDQMPTWWETLHNLQPKASNAPSTDTDGDGSPNVEEYIAGTNPTNPASRFAQMTLTHAPTGTLVIAETLPSRRYAAHTTTNLLDPQTWTPVGSETSGTGTNLNFSITTTNEFRAFRTSVRLAP